MFEQRFAVADDKAEKAFTQLEERSSQSTGIANNTFKRLEGGGRQIAQHHDMQKTLKSMRQKIEDTRASLNQDSKNTKQDFRAYAAQVQQDAEKNKIEPTRFPDEVQQALAHRTTYAAGGQQHPTKLISVKETSVDRLR